LDDFNLIESVLTHALYDVAFSFEYAELKQNENSIKIASIAGRVIWNLCVYQPYHLRVEPESFPTLHS